MTHLAGLWVAFIYSMGKRLTSLWAYCGYMESDKRTCVVCEAEDAAFRNETRHKESQIDVIWECDECGGLFTETFSNPRINGKFP